MKRRILLGILAFLLLGTTGCRSGVKTTQTTERPNEGVTYEKGVDFVGTIKNVDAAGQTIEFYNASFNLAESYPYSGGTEILTKNEAQMTAQQIEQGEVYDVYTSDDGREIVKMQQKQDLIVCEDTTVSVDDSQKRLTVQGVTYAYSDQMPVFSEGKLIQPMEITSEDKITFRGVKGQAYSLVVTKGHGYIQPKNYKDFQGGTILVQGETILPVSKNMLLSVPEGTQTVTMKNGDLVSETSVEVARGKVTEVDISRYQTQVPDTARVRFKVRPAGAELYVNNALQDPSKLISLKYGNHSIKVVLEGYNDYEGVVNIQDPNPTIKIDLAQESAKVEEDSSSSSVSQQDGSSSSSESSKTSYDQEHKITVSAPAGAAVYVDGTYKGVAPCEFTKMIGNVTLTLTKEGYATKSYSVELSDDGQDVTWSFPDLTKKGNG